MKNAFLISIFFCFVNLFVVGHRRRQGGEESWDISSASLSLPQVWTSDVDNLIKNIFIIIIDKRKSVMRNIIRKVITIQSFLNNEQHEQYNFPSTTRQSFVRNYRKTFWKGWKMEEYRKKDLATMFCMSSATKLHTRAWEIFLGPETSWFPNVRGLEDQFCSVCSKHK